VKLAAIGTSGICIFAIFWGGWLIHKTTDVAKLETIRFFINRAVIIAIISALSGVLNAVINAGTISELQVQNTALSTQLTKEQVAAERLDSQLVAKQDTLQHTVEALAALLGSPVIARVVRGSPELRGHFDSLKRVIPPL